MEQFQDKRLDIAASYNRGYFVPRNTVYASWGLPFFTEMLIKTRVLK